MSSQIERDYYISPGHDRSILAAVHEDGGFTALRIVERTGLQSGLNNRMRSGAMRSWLTILERAGLVRKMDDQKPICWVRTQKGTAFLKSRREAKLRWGPTQLDALNGKETSILLQSSQSGRKLE